MHSRRNFIGKVATGLAGTLAASTFLAPTTAFVWHYRAGRSRNADHARGHGLSEYRIRRRRRYLYPPPGRRKENRARRQTYLDYRYLLEDKSVDAVLIATPQHLPLRALHRGARRRQARLPGKDDGVYGGPRQAHARRVSEAGRQTDRADRASVLLLRTGGRRGGVSCKPATDGQDHRDPRAHVPQYSAWQAAVVAARLPRYDAREHHLEIVSGRGAAARLRREPLHELALLLGLLGRQRLREHVPPVRLLVQGDEPADPQSGHHDRRHLSLERRPRSSRHHERLHGAAEEMLFSWDSGFGNNAAGSHRRCPRHRRHHLHRPADLATRRRK